ncbi:MAG: Hsp33 family molecular chaperone HslO [Thermodesulfovibrionales bacterium]
MDILIKAMLKEDPVMVVSLIDTETVEKARKIHDTLPTATAALGRVISGALLLASTLKENQKVTLQIRGDGPIREIIAEADARYRVRAYIKRPHIHMGLKDGKLDVGRAIGKGFINVIRDLGLREVYQSSVPLQTGEIATDLAYYLNVSEQIPSAVSLGVYVDTDNSVKASGGFMIQRLPGARDEVISFIERKLSNVKTASSMILEGLSPLEIIEEAVGLPVDVLDEREVTYYCSCSKERVLGAMVTLGRSEIEEMLKKGENLEVSCRFCGNVYDVTLNDLEVILRGYDNN